MAQNKTHNMEDQPYSLQALIDFVSNNFSLIFMLLVFLGVGFFSGSLWTENQVLKNRLAGNVLGVQPQEVAEAPAAPAGPTEEQLSKVPPVTAKDYIQGSMNAKVILVEYSDYECPFCKKYHESMKQVVADYNGQVAWVYRHYPLSFHQNAQMASEAAECVGNYGGNTAFWKFTNAYLDQTTSTGTGVSRDEMLTLAANAGVSSSAVAGCLDRGDMTEKVKAQMTAGSEAGVSGTPGTIIITSDGKYDFIGGALPIDQIKAKIDQYIK